jgi:hypothetical protein
MKKNILFGSLFTALTLVASVSLAEVPQEVEAFIGKSGKYLDFYNGNETRESGRSCTVEYSKYDSEKTTVVINAPVMFEPNADLQGAKKSIAGNGAIVFKTTEIGRRPGGSQCGDFIPMSGYVKTVEIKNNAIVIRQKFRCGFFEKNDLMSVCDLN